MKILVSVVLILFVSFVTLGQEENYEDLGVSGSSVLSPIEEYKKDIPKDRLFNNNMLDIYFAEKVGTAFGGSNDLVLQKYFASLDASDDSFTIGYTFDDRFGDALKQLDFAFTTGIKFKSEDKFSTIFDSDDFQESNLGAIIKLSYIGNGTIYYRDKIKSVNGKRTIVKQRKKAIEAYRKLIYANQEKVVKDYNNNKFDNDKKKITTLMPLDEDVTNETLDTELEDKQKEIYIAIADAEIKFLNDYKMYRMAYDWWASLDAFIPFGENQYAVVPINNGKATTQNFYGLDIDASLNGFIEWSAGLSIFGDITYNIKRTNNIILDELKTTSFQTGTVDGNGGVIISPAIAAYDTVYDEFTNQSVKLETAFFLFNNTVGFSPAVEWNFSEQYKATNWKLGIPISLKDKEGKPKVNFELQWKEESTLSQTNHLIGISTSFQFGDLIN